MKITPFMLFLILLAVLVIMAIFGGGGAGSSKESFVEGLTSGDQTAIDRYYTTLFNYYSIYSQTARSSSTASYVASTDPNIVSFINNLTGSKTTSIQSKYYGTGSTSSSRDYNNLINDTKNLCNSFIANFLVSVNDPALNSTYSTSSASSDILDADITFLGNCAPSILTLTNLYINASITQSPITSGATVPAVITPSVTIPVVTTSAPTTPATTPAPTTTPTPSLTGNNQDSAISEYFKWYWYWKNSGSCTNPANSDDYILKTQVVPPVCPACPACPTSSVCTNCGGNGGSGTTGGDGSSLVSNSAGGVANNLINTTGNVVGGVALGAGTAVGGVASGVGSTVGGVASGVGSTVGGVASGVGSAVGGAFDSAGNLIQNTGSGVKGFVEDTGSGVKGLLEDVGSGIGNLSSKQQGRQYPGQQQQQQQGNNINPYSYNGMLPAKNSSNFIPITSDFSAFGR